MEVAALVVAIASAVAAVGAVWYARWSAQSAARSADASERSAVASEAAAALETQRRKGELTPRFRVTLEEDPDVEMLRLRVLLAGPPELERLDELTVWIQDDPSWSHIGETAAGLACRASHNPPFPDAADKSSAGLISAMALAMSHPAAVTGGVPVSGGRPQR